MSMEGKRIYPQEPPTLYKFKVPEGVYEQKFNPVTQRMEAVLTEVGKKWIEGKSLIERITEREKEEEEERAELALEIERQIKRRRG